MCQLVVIFIITPAECGGKLFAFSAALFSDLLLEFLQLVTSAQLPSLNLA
jgi:hypothetical protein